MKQFRVSVKAHGKKNQFSNLFLIQELSDHAPPSRVIKDKKVCLEALPECPIRANVPLEPLQDQDNPPYYVLKFSKDGHYLAAGGQDRIIRVWKLVVQSVLEDDQVHNTSPRIFHETPIRRLYGHEGDILDLAWGRSPPQITYSPLQWIEQSGYGILIGMSVWQCSGMWTLSLALLCIPRMIDCFCRDHWIVD